MPRWNRIAPIERVKSYLALHAVTASKATCYGLQGTLHASKQFWLSPTIQQGEEIRIGGKDDKGRDVRLGEKQFHGIHHQANVGAVFPFGGTSQFNHSDLACR